MYDVVYKILTYFVFVWFNKFAIVKLSRIPKKLSNQDLTQEEHGVLYSSPAHGLLSWLGL